MRGCRKKRFYVFAVLLLLVCLSIGYAFLNSTLVINGKSNISKNTWSVHFENIKITDGSVTASVEPAITNNTTIANFELTLDKPGDFYEFTVDVKNSGTIDAMIESVVKTPDLTEEQKKYIDYIIEYQNGEDVLKNQLVKSNDFVRIKVRVEYKKDLSSSDLPTVAETLTLGLDINYVQADDSGIEVFGNGFISVDGDINEIGTVVTIGTEKFYTIGTEAGNVKLLSMYNLDVGNIATFIDFDNGEYVINNIENPTGMQNDNALGLLFDTDGNNKYPWYGTTEFSNDSINYTGSVVEGYVKNYNNLLEINFGIQVEDARLITFEELIDPQIGCDLDYTCQNSPHPWIYSTTYWTSTSFNESSILVLGSIGYFEAVSYVDNYLSGVRPVIEVSLEEFGITDFSPVADGNIDEIGTIVTIGTEKFYTIGTEGNNVKLLSMYNLHVGDIVTDFIYDEEGNETPIINEIIDSHGMQSVRAKAAIYKGFVDDNIRLPWVGVSAFSNDEKHGINYTDYQGSVVEEHVNNYVDKLENKFDVEVLSSRLINFEEVEKLSTNIKLCWVGDLNCVESSYPWLFSISYWIGTSKSSDKVLGMLNMRVLGSFDYNLDYGLGVRPVIEISKNYFE